MQKYNIDYVNEDVYKRLERGLKKYNMLAFKKLNFEYYPALRNGKFVGNLIKKDNNIQYYEVKLPSDRMFSQIHGEIKLIYSVYKDTNIIMLDEITPKDLWFEGSQKELTTYKGVLISKDNEAKNKFQIDLLEMLKH